MSALACRTHAQPDLDIMTVARSREVFEDVNMQMDPGFFLCLKRGLRGDQTPDTSTTTASLRQTHSLTVSVTDRVKGGVWYNKNEE